MISILVVDDDPAIQRLLQRTLERQGYNIILASDGQEGLEKAKESRPAMIICDWLMPKMTGIEMCRQVKAIAELSTTFFILLTALGSVEDRVKGLDAGADDFLCKPIEMYELLARVRSGLRLHQLSSDLQKQKLLLEAELGEAAEYVCSILPEPLEEPPISIDVKFIPSRQLGGDSFDYFWLDARHIAIYLLDVAGHGLRAALPSLAVVNLLRSRGLNNVNYYYPSEVLKGLNRTFQMTDRNDKYFTIWYGVYNIKKRQLVYSSAGHPPAILFSHDSSETMIYQPLKTWGFPIGMFPDSEYTDAYCRVNSDSCLYIFSDGIYEMETTPDIVWNLETFLDFLKEQNKDNLSLDEILELIKSHIAQDYFDDDLSIMKVIFS
jgi:phosphoserine phosphatase RsbU/P